MKHETDTSACQSRLCLLYFFSLVQYFLSSSLLPSFVLFFVSFRFLFHCAFLSSIPLFCLPTCLSISLFYIFLLLFLDFPFLFPLSSYSFFLICRLTFSLLRTGVIRQTCTLHHCQTWRWRFLTAYRTARVYWHCLQPGPWRSWFICHAAFLPITVCHFQWDMKNRLMT